MWELRYDGFVLRHLHECLLATCKSVQDHLLDSLASGDHLELLDNPELLLADPSHHPDGLLLDFGSANWLDLLVATSYMFAEAPIAAPGAILYEHNSV